MKTTTKCPVDEKLSKDNSKICIIPVALDKKPMESNTFPPIDGKPNLLFPEFYGKGVDNAAYYDPSEMRRAARLDTQKHKFTSRCVPGESDGAKLTKIPGLNIWRLDFKKPATKASSSTSWHRITSTVAMITILALLISGVAIIIHAVKGGLIFGLPWFPFESEDDALGVSRVAAHFRIMNRNFVSELEDPSSAEHAQLLAELKHTLDVLFMDSPLTNYYNASNNFEFANGSVVVSCVVLLKRPLPDGAQKVGFAFVRALEEGKGILPPGMFYVDVHTVRFAAMKTESTEMSMESLHDIGQWSEWSSCMKNGTCDTTRIRVRRRHCGASREDLCASHTEIVETRPCLCPHSIATLTTSALLLPGEWSKWSPWTSCLTFSHLCDPHQIQRRTRSCVGLRSKTLPSTVCTRRTGESAMQIRHCLCTAKIVPEENQDTTKETTLQIFENDYLHWLIPV